MSGRSPLAERSDVATPFGCVGDAVGPAAVDHAGPGPGKDADTVLVVVLDRYCRITEQP